MAYVIKLLGKSCHWTFLLHVQAAVPSPKLEFPHMAQQICFPGLMVIPWIFKRRTSVHTL